MQSPVETDHYQVLGLPKTASQDDVRRAYKQLAREWHPDKNPQQKDHAEQKFKEISEAHRVLSNEQLRLEYDQAREHEERARFREAHRRRNDNIRRQEREQREYVRKQEEKRRKARRARSHTPSPFTNTINEFGDFDTVFQDFFEDRETWRGATPNFYSAETSSIGQMMKNILNITNDMSYGATRVAPTPTKQAVIGEYAIVTSYGRLGEHIYKFSPVEKTGIVIQIEAREAVSTDYTTFTTGFTDSTNINQTFDRFFSSDSYSRYQR